MVKFHCPAHGGLPGSDKVDSSRGLFSQGRLLCAPPAPILVSRSVIFHNNTIDK
jgi:hypothetical protein